MSDELTKQGLMEGGFDPSELDRLNELPVGQTLSQDQIPEEYLEYARQIYDRPEVQRQLVGQAGDDQRGSIVIILAIASFLLQFIQFLRNRKVARMAFKYARSHPHGLVAAAVARKIEQKLPEQIRHRPVAQGVVEVVAAISDKIDE